MSVETEFRVPETLFEECSSIIQQVYPALTLLEKQAEFLMVPGLSGREWFELLRQKLVPQLGDQAYLVVAVVGGTNIGKSVIFNHLAGCRASASSPLASGTRHPVCLVPERFAEHHTLASVFPDFELQEWTDAALALEETDRHQLFWRTEASLPSTLLILDTPDIDSDARINWIRADAVRRSADVLVAVLTQQKYNDAAVKEFFRKAAEEDKVVLVVFNQCLLPEDEPYWPIWLKTFCRETGISPDAVYLCPNDRRAAEELRLPFLERGTPTQQDVSSSAAASTGGSGSLGADLARLKFREIRLRSLLGAVRELQHPERGIPGYLRELSHASEDLRRTSVRLASGSVVQVRDWPVPSGAAITAEIRLWWQSRQQGWAKTINSAYSAVGNGLLWPFRAARRSVQGEPLPPLEDYRNREWAAILMVVEELFSKLQLIAESGHKLIRPRVELLLGGDSRSRVLMVLRQNHDQFRFDEELRSVVDERMQELENTRPDLFGVYRRVNDVAAAVRPVTSVVLFSIGFGPAGEIAANLLGHAATSAAVHVIADVAGGAAAAIAGEAAVANAAGSGAGLLQAWFHSFHAAFTTRRAAWLTRLIHDELLGSLPQELQAAAAISESPVFRDVQQSVSRLAALRLPPPTESNAGSPGGAADRGR